MTTRNKPVSKLRSFFIFFGLGILVCLVSFVFFVQWPRLYTRISGKEFVHDFQPPGFKFIYEMISYAAWWVGGLVLIWQSLKRKWITSLGYATGASTVYLSFVALLLFGPQVKSYLEREAFDSRKWIEADRSNTNVRQRMVDDLLKTHSLVGKSRTEIEALLGPPTEDSPRGNFDLIYWLGPERGFIQIDSEWLLIRFENDRVIEVKVRTD